MDLSNNEIEKVKCALISIKNQYTDILSGGSRSNEIFSNYIKQIEEIENQKRIEIQKTYEDGLKFAYNELDQAKRAIEADAEAQKKEADMKIEKSLLFKKEKLFEEFKAYVNLIDKSSLEICKNNTDDVPSSTFASYEVSNEPSFNEEFILNAPTPDSTKYTVNNNKLLYGDNVLSKCSLVLSSEDEIDVSVNGVSRNKVEVVLEGSGVGAFITMECLKYEFCKLR